MSRNKKNMVWMDLEMTGLYPDRDTIIEIATIITNTDLEILAEGPVFAIHQPDDILNNMDNWNTEHHTASGLLSRVRDSRVTMPEAEGDTLRFIKAWVGPRESPICGNSVWQDRRFLLKYMPDVAAYLHYRCIDVSTIKELVHRWYDSNIRPPRKNASHLAMEDIKESIQELRYYRSHVFR